MVATNNSQLTLANIVDSVIGRRGTIKTAADTCAQCGRPAMPDSKLCRECAEKDARKNEQESAPADVEKTSSERVEKLASAVQFIVEHPENIYPVLGQVKRAGAPPMVASGGPGKGPNAMPTTFMAATPGEQSAISGQARTKVPMNSKGEKAIPGDQQPSNAVEDNLRDMKPPYPKEGPLKQASFRDRFVSALRKRAADSQNPASIASGKISTLPENQPDRVKRPAEVTSQERLIASNQAAINATKRQAKAVPKKRMGEVISEPAQTRSTDKILDQNLGRETVDRAGAKVASARDLLSKVAAEGCTCNGAGTCGHCRVAVRLRQRQSGQEVA